ncbi:hypothetical protein ABEF95_001965 [Exophiala dermatitidis]
MNQLTVEEVLSSHRDFLFHFRTILLVRKSFTSPIIHLANTVRLTFISCFQSESKLLSEGLKSALAPMSPARQTFVKAKVCHGPPGLLSARVPTSGHVSNLLAPHRSPSFPASIKATLPRLPSFLHSSRKFSVVMEPCQRLEMITPTRSCNTYSKPASYDHQVVYLRDRPGKVAYDVADERHWIVRLEMLSRSGSICKDGTEAFRGRLRVFKNMSKFLRAPFHSFYLQAIPLNKSTQLDEDGSHPASYNES